jgi:hypothetical protein
MVHRIEILSRNPATSRTMPRMIMMSLPLSDGRRS